MKTIIFLLLIIIVLLSGIGILLLNRIPPGPASESSGREKCLENQKQLETAIDWWSVENNKRVGDMAPQRHDFKCPSGGEYIIGRVGDKPRCSLETHQPETAAKKSKEPK